MSAVCRKHVLANYLNQKFGSIYITYIIANNLIAVTICERRMYDILQIYEYRFKIYDQF